MANAIDGTSILLTGATGFLGRSILYKLLSLQRGPRRIDLLVRARDDRAAEERIAREILGANAPHAKFAPGALERVRALAGDVTAPQLGLDAARWQSLGAEVDLIISNAATVRFDESIDVALATNVLPVRTLLALARFQGHAAKLVHVSTAYVHGLRSDIAPEQAPEPGWAPSNRADEPAFDLDRELEWAQDLPRRVAAEHAEPRAAKMVAAIGHARARELGFTDTYTYSKSLAEQLLTRDAREIETSIVRPAIIESAWAEPEPGWISGLRMADPLIAAFGRGQLRSLPANPASVLDLVPVDFVTRAILASAGLVRAQRPRVFHVASGLTRPVTISDLERGVRAHFRERPAIDRSGQPMRYAPVRFQSKRVFHLSTQLRQDIPSRAYLALARRLRLEPHIQRASKLRSKLEGARRFLDMYADYMDYRGRFDTTQTEKMVEALSPSDRPELYFRMNDVDWDRYFRVIHVEGLRRHVLQW